MLFNIALNYGGRTEIVDAARRAIAAGCVPRISTRRRSRASSTPRGQPDPDLLIRTSGEMRVSNYLLWQIAYAEIYVTDTLWPDFRRRHLLEAVLAYQKRERRYGGISPTPAAIGAQMTSRWSRLGSAASCMRRQRRCAAIVWLPPRSPFAACVAAACRWPLPPPSSTRDAWLDVARRPGRCRRHGPGRTVGVGWFARSAAMCGRDARPIAVLAVAAAAVRGRRSAVRSARRSAGWPRVFAAIVHWHAARPAGGHAAPGWRATLLLIATVVVSDSLQYYSGPTARPAAAGADDQPEEDDRRRHRRRDRRHAVHGCSRARWLFRAARVPLWLGSGWWSCSSASAAICSSRRLKRAAGVKDSS